MNKQKIENIHKKIEKIFCQNAQNTPERNELMKNFWEHHVLEVLGYSMQMAKEYGANEELVYLGALLHDIALAYGMEPHDELGAIEAKEFMLANGYDNEFAEKVSNIVLTHRCKKFAPNTLEEKIVASADAIAHFLPAYYLGIAAVAKEDYPSVINDSIYKLEKDYENKIFFEKERRLLKDRMRDFKKWFY